jgi:hypothetical protein
MEIFRIVTFCFYLPTYLAYHKVQAFGITMLSMFLPYQLLKQLTNFPKLVERVTNRNHQKTMLFKLLYRVFYNVLRDYKKL